MSESLPKRPDLDQLRRRAKELRDAARRSDADALARFAQHHPAAGRSAVTLAAAQLVVARELGFASWPTLKAALDLEAAARGETSTLLAAALDGSGPRVAAALARGSDIMQRDVRAAAALGDVDTARRALALDPSAAVAIDEERGWPPLLYACYSRWHDIEPGGAAGLAEVVQLLLEAGASPNTNDGGRPRYRSALKGSVEVNNPAVTEVLLHAGASPDPGEPIAEAVRHRDQRCLKLLLAHGARVERTWALGAAVFHDDAAALSLLLDALSRRGVPVADIATEALPEAVVGASLPVVLALLDAGAAPMATDDEGRSAYRLAVRAGKPHVAARLREAGAPDDSTDVDRLLGAAVTGDRRTAIGLLATRPDLMDRLSDQDRAVIVDVSAAGSAEAVALMLDLGFAANVSKDGDQPLHNAAYHGNAEVVRLLLTRGVDIDARDGRFDSTALAFATVGSREQAGRPGDWITTVRLLLDAGASREEIWIAEKPPSGDIADLLRSYGIFPPDVAGAPTGDESLVAGSIGNGVMAEMAQHLEAAHVHRDLDLLASLLHPEVRWTGDCTNREQVLVWYRGLLDEGTAATVNNVEVDRDAVILDLSVSGAAEGARPTPPQRLWQVFTVADAQVIDIRGYSDHATALARA